MIKFIYIELVSITVVFKEEKWRAERGGGRLEYNKSTEPTSRLQ